MEHSLYDVDKEARFQKVYDAYMQDVYRLCFSYMKNKMDTEDAVQETFCRFYQAMERVKEKEHVKGWLLVTAGNGGKIEAGRKMRRQKGAMMNMKLKCLNLC